MATPLNYSKYKDEMDPPTPGKLYVVSTRSPGDMYSGKVADHVNGRTPLIAGRADTVISTRDIDRPIMFIKHVEMGPTAPGAFYCIYHFLWKDKFIFRDCWPIFFYDWFAPVKSYEQTAKLL